jgi:hypothetical protein
MSQLLLNSIDQASKIIGKTWPLHTFVASNPLSGYEAANFEDALLTAKKYLSAHVFPKATLYRQAWKKGDISKDALTKLLLEKGLKESPEYYLQILESKEILEKINPNHYVDIIMSKWLAAFMDEGLAEWDMPFKSEGFYTAWRNLVIYDSEVGETSLKEIPKSSKETLENILKDFSESAYVKIFSYHLGSLPGWTGYINHRIESNSEWQNEFPISMIDYLAARLWTVKKINGTILPNEELDSDSENLISKLNYIWLSAWEKTWQDQLIETLTNQSIENKTKAENEIAEAQMVFCIDTRSELIRRNIESKGNFETFGYAGFFGIAMDYENLNDGIVRKSCPPIVTSAYKVTEKSQLNKEKAFLNYQKSISQQNFSNYFVTRMKNMLPSAFGFVEGSGLYYGFSLIARTVNSSWTYKSKLKNSEDKINICQPQINSAIKRETLSLDIPLSEKVSIVKSAFDLMGWKNFAPIVLFVGHGSHSANNPFGSSLDCGACAASPGRHNARMLASLANLPEVREELNVNFGIKIPENTIFIGAEHNTTTDSIVLFDSEIPNSFNNQLQNIKSKLFLAQKTATEERLGTSGNSVNVANKKANDWGETRPEWGLAKNAGFIIGSRDLTKNKNLDSRCFLHSYDWALDKTGKALEGIMQGPMVVTQWINNHYYFSTVDNEVFGGGSKITHNITGKFGVVQGNGGDLKMGLPMQSLYETDEIMYHKPLRLSVVINAPIERISEILERNDNLKSLLDNEWIYLIAIDPLQENKVFQYQKAVKWISL